MSSTSELSRSSSGNHSIAPAATANVANANDLKWQGARLMADLFQSACSAAQVPATLVAGGAVLVAASGLQGRLQETMNFQISPQLGIPINTISIASPAVQQFFSSHRGLQELAKPLWATGAVAMASLVGARALPALVEAFAERAGVPPGTAKAQGPAAQGARLMEAAGALAALVGATGLIISQPWPQLNIDYSLTAVSPHAPPQVINVSNPFCTLVHPFLSESPAYGSALSDTLGQLADTPYLTFTAAIQPIINGSLIVQDAAASDNPALRLSSTLTAVGVLTAGTVLCGVGKAIGYALQQQQPYNQTAVTAARVQKFEERTLKLEHWMLTWVHTTFYAAVLFSAADIVVQSVDAAFLNHLPACADGLISNPLASTALMVAGLTLGSMAVVPFTSHVRELFGHTPQHAAHEVVQESLYWSTTPMFAGGSLLLHLAEAARLVCEPTALWHKTFGTLSGAAAVLTVLGGINGVAALARRRIEGNTYIPTPRDAWERFWRMLPPAPLVALLGVGAGLVFNGWAQRQSSLLNAAPAPAMVPALAPAMVPALAPADWLGEIVGGAAPGLPPSDRMFRTVWGYAQMAVGGVAALTPVAASLTMGAKFLRLQWQGAQDV